MSVRHDARPSSGSSRDRARAPAAPEERVVLAGRARPAQDDLVAVVLAVAAYWVSASSASGPSPAASPSAWRSVCSTTWPPSTGCCASSPPVSSRPATSWRCPPWSGCSVLSVVAVGIAVWFWPDGIGLLLRPGDLPADRPRDDHRAPAEGAEGPMIGARRDPGRHQDRRARPAAVPGHDVQHGHDLDHRWSPARIVVLLGFWARAQLTRDTDDHVPTKLQLIWEGVVNQVNDQVEDNLGQVNPFAVALAVVAVLLHPDRELARDDPERAQRALALPAGADGRHQPHLRDGADGDDRRLVLRHLARRARRATSSTSWSPTRSCCPLNIIEEITKPISLALRLFGNIFAGGILLALIGSLTAWTVGNIPVGGVLSVCSASCGSSSTWPSAAIQAFIFALLTVLYFGMAGGPRTTTSTTTSHDDTDGRRRDR